MQKEISTAEIKLELADQKFKIRDFESDQFVMELKLQFIQVFLNYMCAPINQQTFAVCSIAVCSIAFKGCLFIALR